MGTCRSRTGSGRRLALAVAAFVQEAYEALGAIGFGAVFFAWAAATNDRQADES